MSILNEISSRAGEIEKLLSDSFFTIGKKITDRSAWEAVSFKDGMINYVKSAEKILESSYPELTDEIFLEYSKTGSRALCDKVMHERIEMIQTLCIAECLENQGRFVKKYEEFALSLCKQKSWVLSVHDTKLDCFYGRRMIIDLLSATTSWRMAICNYLLDDVVSENVRLEIRKNIEERTLKPYMAALKGEAQLPDWIDYTTNWNSVCLAGVTGSALCMLESKSERAVYLAAYEKFISGYQKGITHDGYCSEGLGYWSYGFGHFLAFSEFVRLNTDNRIDYLNDMKNAGVFPVRMEMNDGVYPSISDCPYDVKLKESIMFLACKRFGVKSKKWLENDGVFNFNPYTYELLLAIFWNDETNVVITPDVDMMPQRSFYESAGVLICRSDDKDIKMSVAIKGGHNNENHNHNDLGSFIVAVNDEKLISDPGSIIYDSKTFSSERFKEKILSSYGHGVPLVADETQAPKIFECDKWYDNPLNHAVITEKIFTDNKDEITFDLTSAYEVKELVKLERKFEYQRSGCVCLKVTDSYAFTEPQNFETAIMTYDKVELCDNGFSITGKNYGLKVDIDSDNYIITREEIYVNSRDMIVNRVAIHKKSKEERGTVSVTISPVRL